MGTNYNVLLFYYIQNKLALCTLQHILILSPSFTEEKLVEFSLFLEVRSSKIKLINNK